MPQSQKCTNEQWCGMVLAVSVEGVNHDAHCCLNTELMFSSKEYADMSFRLMCVYMDP